MPVPAEEREVVERRPWLPLVLLWVAAPLCGVPVVVAIGWPAWTPLLVVLQAVAGIVVCGVAAVRCIDGSDQRRALARPCFPLATGGAPRTAEPPGGAGRPLDGRSFQRNHPPHFYPVAPRHSLGAARPPLGNPRPTTARALPMGGEQG